MVDPRSLVRHPASATFVGTVVAYGVILAIITAVVFVVPYLLFRFL